MSCVAWTVASSGCSDRLDWCHGQSPRPSPQATLAATAPGAAPYRGGARRVRLRGQAGGRRTRDEDLPLSGVRPRDQAEHCSRRGVEGRARGVRGRRSPTLAHTVLGQADRSQPDEEVVLETQCSSEAGSTSSTSTPPASLGWMKLIREFAVPRRGASYSNRTPCSRSRSDSASRSLTR